MREESKKDETMEKESGPTAAIKMTRGQGAKFEKAATALERLGAIESEKERQEIENLISLEMGFTRVIGYLKEAKKPIVGHAMIYDALFLYNQFVG